MYQKPSITNSGKAFKDLSKSQVNRKLKILKDEAERALWFAESFGLIPETLTFRDSCDQNQKFRLDFDEESSSKKSFDKLSDMDKSRIQDLLYVLDSLCVSDAAYHEISMLNSGSLPSNSLIVQCRESLNKIFSIYRAEGGIPGAYVSLKEAICSKIEKENLDSSKKIEIRISGDGARMTKTSNFITVAFNFLNAGLPDKPIALGILKGSESYENFKTGLKPLIDEINDLISSKQIDIDGKTYEINILLGGDLKFIQMFLGLKGSTAKYSCPWCKVSQDDRYDTSKAWDFYHNDYIARTHENLCDDALRSQFCVERLPLFSVDMKNLVVDELHLLLRVGDVLLRNLIFDIKDVDDEASFARDLSASVIGQNLHGLVRLIQECGVVFHIWEVRDPVTLKGTGKLEWSSLQGSEFKKLFNQLPDKLSTSKIMHEDTMTDVLKLWADFISLHSYITSTGGTDIHNHLSCFEKAKSFVNLFLSLGSKRKGYKKANVTPYMHVLLYHVPFLIKEHGPISRYSGQSIEKLNDVVKSINMSKSNRSDGPKDALTVLKRIEYLNKEGHQRKKRKYSKENTKLWDEEKKSRAQNKKRKILDEINSDTLFRKQAPIPSTVEGVKSELQKLGFKTNARNYDRLKSILLMRRELAGQ
ncbi:uncharacterized protein LOC141915078 [Tubulanus polymorphus]|uniref:uncharacterized protein LOC141915078 n=1 Tax=Tubulanus polymorphus TaxID=672921 RepID=UPI003DA49AD4